jgi:hypothetical protein
MNPEYTDKLLETTRAAATDVSSIDPQTVLHAAYAAIIRGDFDALGESMTRRCRTEYQWISYD